MLQDNQLPAVVVTLLAAEPLLVFAQFPSQCLQDGVLCLDYSNLCFKPLYYLYHNRLQDISPCSALVNCREKFHCYLNQKVLFCSAAIS